MISSIIAFFNFSTLMVIVAALLDILANMLLAASGGFRRWQVGLSAIVLVGVAFYCLSVAVRDMDLAVARALWGSFGILGTSLGGWLVFRQKLKPIAFAGIAVLIGGMLLLRFG